MAAVRRRIKRRSAGRARGPIFPARTASRRFSGAWVGRGNGDDPRSHPGAIAEAPEIPDETSWSVGSFSGLLLKNGSPELELSLLQPRVPAWETLGHTAVSLVF